MYRSQINSILDMLEDCGSRADYVDLRRIVNRYVAECGKSYPAPQRPEPKITQPWHTNEYSQLMQKAGDELHKALMGCYCEYYYTGELISTKKIALIKAFRDFGGYTPGENSQKYYHIGLLAAKQFVEKYFGAWC